MHDFRGQITDETHCVIEAQHRVTGRTHQDIVREVLHAWASDRLHEASLIHQLAQAEGIAPEAVGLARNPVK